MHTSELIDAVHYAAGQTNGLTKRQVRDVLRALPGVLGEAIKRPGSEVKLPGVVKLTKVKKDVPAIKAGTIVKNRFTGEEGPHPGRPKSSKIVVKARPLAGVKG